MILVSGIALLAIAFVIMWRYWPDPDAADDLPALGDSIDRAIALAAALPAHQPGCGRMAYSWRFGRPEPCTCGAEPQYARDDRVYLTELGAKVARAL